VALIMALGRAMMMPGETLALDSFLDDPVFA
jgi:hypothetical protein